MAKNFNFVTIADYVKIVLALGPKFGFFQFQFQTKNQRLFRLLATIDPFLNNNIK